MRISETMIVSAITPNTIVIVTLRMDVRRMMRSELSGRLLVQNFAMQRITTTLIKINASLIKTIEIIPLSVMYSINNSLEETNTAES